MIITRAALAAILIGLLGVPLATEAQQAGQVPRIGHLSGLSPSVASATREAFLQRLREVGYVEGK